MTEPLFGPPNVSIQRTPAFRGGRKELWDLLMRCRTLQEWREKALEAGFPPYRCVPYRPGTRSGFLNFLVHDGFITINEPRDRLRSEPLRVVRGEFALYDRTPAVAKAEPERVSRADMPKPTRISSVLPSRQGVCESGTGAARDAWTTRSIFEFWDRDINPDVAGRYLHPEDYSAYHHGPQQGPKGVTVKASPVPFTGPLRTAKVVFLALNPGISERNPAFATMAEDERYARAQRSGSSIYGLHGWLKQRAMFLALPSHDPVTEWVALEPHVAKLNRYAYGSKAAGSDERRLLESLPSSAVHLEWARDVLFPMARRGERAVICLRGHRAWGLEPDVDEGTALFCSTYPRGGRVRLEHQQRIRAVVRDLIGLRRA